MDNSPAVAAQAARGPLYEEFVLNQLRCASLTARLLACEIDSLGLALKAGWLSADAAIQEVAAIGALGLIREQAA